MRQVKNLAAAGVWQGEMPEWIVVRKACGPDHRHRHDQRVKRLNVATTKVADQWVKSLEAGT